MIPIVEKTLGELKNSDQTFQTVFQVIRNNFRDEIFGEKPENGRVKKTSYRELAALTEKAADSLSDLFGKEKRSGIIGIYMDNSVEWVACFWGILKAGFVPLLLNTRQDLQVTRGILEEMKPEAVITDHADIPGKITVEALMNRSCENSCGEDRWEDRIILVTSGSTDRPKIIVHSGKSICSQVSLSADLLERNITARHNRKLEVRILAFLPFYHIFGLVAGLLWFSFFGRTFIFLPDMGALTIQKTCRELSVSHFFAVPLVWEGVVRKLLSRVQAEGKTEKFMKLIRFSNSFQTAFVHFGPWLVRNVIFKSLREKLLGSNVNFLISGGGFLSAAAREVMNGLGYSLYCGYGLTECGIVSVNLSRKAKERLSASCGPVFSNISFRVNEQGELQIGRSSCFEGRYSDGKFIPNTEEYYNTSDLVRFDEKGELFPLGRTDDMIITENGENISPEDVESRLDINALVSATMVYVNWQGTKQMILAVEMDETDTASLRAEVLKKLFDSLEKLPMQERPSRVLSIAGAIPRNVKGIDRRELGRMLSEGKLLCEEITPVKAGEIGKYHSEEYKTILAQVKNCFVQVMDLKDEISDTANFVSLGGDSMMYVELMQTISEKLHIDMNFTEKPLVTPSAFADYIYEIKRENS